jgi:tetratricopeptide (TPR) repeat protein
LGRAWRHKDPAKAYSFVTRAAELEPENWFVLDLLAEFLIERNALDEAERVITRGLELAKFHAPLYYRRSRLHVLRNNISAAAADARKAVALDGTKGYLHSNLVRVLEAAGSVDKSEEALGIGLECDPRHAPLHYQLSRMRMRHGDIEGAVAAARKAVSLDPTQAYMHDNLAVLLLTARQFNEARRAAEAGLLVAPNHAPLHYHLSLVLAHEGDFAGALSEAREAVRLDSGEGYLWENLVRRLLESEGTGETEAALRDAFRRVPQHAPLHYLESKLLLKQGDVDGAVAAARKAVARAPAEGYLHEGLVTVLQAAGREKEAKSALAAALRAAPAHAPLHYRMSVMKDEEGDRAGAIESAREAVRLDPEQGYLQENLVRHLLEEADDTEAEAALYSALKYVRDYGPLYYLQSKLMLRRGNLESAITAARRSAELAPDSSYMCDHLRKLLELERKVQAACIGADQQL